MLSALWQMIAEHWVFVLIILGAVISLGAVIFQMWMSGKLRELDVIRNAYAVMEDRCREVEKEAQRLRGEKTAAATELARTREAREDLENETVEGQKGFSDLKERFKKLEDDFFLEQRKNHELFEEKEEVEKKYDELGEERDARIKELKARLDDESRKADEYHKKAVRLEWHVRQVTQCGGRIWETPVSVKSVPEFRKRWGKHPRHARIISMMNYKGGVGKSTIAANLGATLWRQFGKKVLLVDLDFQSSLSSLCLSRGTLDGLARDDAFVHSLFQQKPAGYEDVLFYARKIRDEESCKCDILATDQELANVEERLMMQWIVGETPDDIRFRLRTLLHDDMIANEYDYIILDCPPRNTTASINALTASDYVMVPVLLDQTSAEAVPRLLEMLRRMKDDEDVPPICRDINVLGIVANRVLQDGRMTPDEHHVWTELDRHSKKRWGMEKWWDDEEEDEHETEEPGENSRRRMPGFNRSIPDRVDFGRAAGKHALAVFQSSEIQRVFVELAEQLVSRVETHEGMAIARSTVDEDEEQPARGKPKPGVFARPKRSLTSAAGRSKEDGALSHAGDGDDLFGGGSPGVGRPPLPPSYGDQGPSQPPSGPSPVPARPKAPNGPAANAAPPPQPPGATPANPPIRYSQPRPSGTRKPRPR